MPKMMRENDRKQYASRLAAPGNPDASLLEDLAALKGADRSEIAVTLAALPASSGRAENAETAFTAAIPTFLGDDYARGVKPDIAAKRIAAATRAARRAAGTGGEAKLIVALV